MPYSYLSPHCPTVRALNYSLRPGVVRPRLSAFCADGGERAEAQQGLLLGERVVRASQSIPIEREITAYRRTQTSQYMKRAEGNKRNKTDGLFGGQVRGSSVNEPSRWLVGPFRSRRTAEAGCDAIAPTAWPCLKSSPKHVMVAYKLREGDN